MNPDNHSYCRLPLPLVSSPPMQNSDRQSSVPPLLALPIRFPYLPRRWKRLTGLSSHGSAGTSNQQFTILRRQRRNEHGPHRRFLILQHGTPLVEDARTRRTYATSHVIDRGASSLL